MDLVCEPGGLLYACYSVERCPTTSKLHLQGFLQLDSRGRTLGGLKKLLNLPTGHFEPTVKSQAANLAYTSKGDSHVAGPFTFGELEAPLEKRPREKKPKESVMAKVIPEIQAGKTDLEIVTDMPSLLLHPGTLPYARSLLPYIGDKTRDVRVYLLWGAPCTGKSTQAKAKFPDYFYHTGPFDKSTFKPYKGESTVIIDAFMDHGWKMSILEKCIKPDIVTVAVLNSFIRTTWTTFVITTNQDPNEMYTRNHWNRDALFRRIYKIIHVEIDPATGLSPPIDWE